MSWNQDEAEKQFRGTYGWEAIPEDWVIGEPPLGCDFYMIKTLKKEEDCEEEDSDFLSEPYHNSEKHIEDSILENIAKKDKR
jgi:hypothetical protein